MIDRLISSQIKSSRKSILLLGPRQVGKSSLIKSLKPDLYLNLADQSVFFEMIGDPNFLRHQIESKNPRVVFLDEIQRAPDQLNTVQVLIDDLNLKFYLTGSSARKLKRGSANLLPGRVVNFRLGPLVAAELGYKADVRSLMQYGSLPGVFTSNKQIEKQQILSSYGNNYLREEIQAEALTRSLEGFTRFFNTASLQVGKFIDYTKLAKSARISRHTCPNFFEILEDTLVAERIYPEDDLIEKYDLIKHPKFYFFDVGVFNGLVGHFDLSPERMGSLAEQLVYSQIVHSAMARQLNWKLSTFRTRGGREVDFVLKLGRSARYAIEVKSGDHYSSDDVSNLVFLKNEEKIEPLLIHMGKSEKKLNGVWCLPLFSALKEMGL